MKIKSNYITKIAFAGLHFSCLGIFFVNYNLTALLVFIITFSMRTFALTAGYHRYFAHKSFQTSRTFQFILALIGTWASQKGPLWWSGHHRYHHIHSDKTTDLHSPKNGFFQSHISWIFNPTNNSVDSKYTKGWSKYPEIVWLDKFSHLSFFLYLIGLFVIGNFVAYKYPNLGTSGLSFVFFGGILSTVLLYHTTFSVNSFCHIFGSKDYLTTDNSRNNWLIAILTFGEGWHNNHHKFAYSVRNNLKFWQIDITYIILSILKKLRIVWGFKQPKI
ncbi:acyl-CoA desaturase [Allofrancisella guangzhouensis]|uniref:Delta 9 acyl-lipid fatty acid desaturase n=1 Tax=Allofrancisella guangzhouensis TaxID=594679 RepID=A0A0A8EB11_9GAMM|nr:acyl-CoA desaturase [Allofrancisella guangzhouensis]AJC49366.1 delta 9 acyl-lipid fatty acid desaturase [Allofrancisella guangzhouensis]MBK2026993.1 acyl-CoA desaturase [Allofrancisella guangzhouensis]MBK2043901.1 acyl-CoA desaturase [Allofrancisella guangzhouensis]MBK2044986.1 acyl-CoA desaturase [Allofrancisella guangzhouensis]